MSDSIDPESQRLVEDARRQANWKRWGPYLSERQWGTVREDYSANGDAWNYFPHDHARSRVYRWGEDGLLGFTDRECRLCFALALWNENDPFLKERLFGLANGEGNHGEDVKEIYFYLDSTPTHSWCEALYRYPQQAFPYDLLRSENARRTRLDPEFEILDTGIFDSNRFWDVHVTYAKASPDDVLIRLAITNQGPESAPLHLLPMLWFRNTWSWGSRLDEGLWSHPILRMDGADRIRADHATLGTFHLACGPGPGGTVPTFLFTENETNRERLYGILNATPHVKDAFHDYVVNNVSEAVNPQQVGTKAAVYHQLRIEPGQRVEIRLRLAPTLTADPLGVEFERVMQIRQQEADRFYAQKLPSHLSSEAVKIAREAYAGLCWSKQFYHYVVSDWLDGDPGQPPPPALHTQKRNTDWRTLFNRDVILMPDKWEYPWYATWDLAFHAVAMARIDPTFAKEQLLLFLREWYMHPNGELPAYEWNLNDANPPVHAWACWRVYADSGRNDIPFLKRAFHKLLLNFTWWVNRKDADGRNLFTGGFLGLDNISLFDRSRPLPEGGNLEQADATAWMAFYCLSLLTIALELAEHDIAYEDVASKFFEHFVSIADAMNAIDGGLWDDVDGFYYDHVHAPTGNKLVRVRSLVGLIPLLACTLLDDEKWPRFPGFRKRAHWFLTHRGDLHSCISHLDPQDNGSDCLRLLALPSRDRLERILHRLLDEREFLSPHGIRSLSLAHRDHPVTFGCGGQLHQIRYEPGDSESNLFGGNSNWRGPIWMPLNYLLIQALDRLGRFYDARLMVEMPTGSGNRMTLCQVARELARRLSLLFLPDDQGRRPCHGDDTRWGSDPLWRDRVLFHEYFHGDNGRGLGANHQTGWTALIAPLLKELVASPI